MVAANVPYDVLRIRQDFPILERLVHQRKGRPGKLLAYLDSAASAQKPRQVIDAMAHFMAHDYANVHRGVHALSQRATDLYEAARDKAAAFIGASSRESIVFVRNATEGFNLIAQSWGATHLKAGDIVVLSDMEHHANIVPWQLLQARIGIGIKVVPVLDDGSLDLEAYERLLDDRAVKLVSLAHVSNALGTVNPVERLAAAARTRSVPIMFDGSQAVVHQPVDIATFDPDFYVFTGHKLYGPTGIGIVYGKPERLESMPPWQGGGDMIASVSFQGTTFRPPPHRFEAGTPPIIEGVGLAAAFDYLTALGMQAVQGHERALLRYAHERLRAIEGLRLIGEAPEKAGILSFVMEGIHPHDIGTYLDQQGIAIRVGRHCAEPLMERFGISGTARASLGLYTTREEMDRLADGLHACRAFFG
jgi:cysteine desulfurase / selenocysteine lyase